MYRLKTLLALISAFSVLALLWLCFLFLKDCYKRIRYKTPIRWRSYNIFEGVNSLSSAIVPVLLIVGLINAVGMEFFTKAEIGAFYEKASYQTDYDAMLTIENRTEMFCIATVERGDGEYRIAKLSLPYGKTQFPEDAYFGKDDDKISLYIGSEGCHCKLTLDEPSTPTSYSALKSYAISSTGDFCASRNSSKYHHHAAKCRYVKKIEKENLVYFKYRSDADVLGYSYCKNCRESVY